LRGWRSNFGLKKCNTSIERMIIEISLERREEGVREDGVFIQTPSILSSIVC
jgi:hypothetical protein